MLMISKLIKAQDESNQSFDLNAKSKLYKEYNDIHMSIKKVILSLGHIDFTMEQPTNFHELYQYLSNAELVRMLLPLDKTKQDDILSGLDSEITKYIILYLAFAPIIPKLLNLYTKEVEDTETQKFELYLEYSIIANKVEQFKIVTINYENALRKWSNSPPNLTNVANFKTYTKAFYQYLSTTELVKILLPLDKTIQNDILLGLDSEITKCIRLCLAFSIMISKQSKSDSEEGKSTEKQISKLYLDYNAIEVKVLAISNAKLYLQQYDFVKMLLRLNITDQDTILSYLTPAVSNIIRKYLDNYLANKGDHSKFDNSAYAYNRTITTLL